LFEHGVTPNKPMRVRYHTFAILASCASLFMPAKTHPQVVMSVKCQSPDELSYLSFSLAIKSLLFVFKSAYLII